MAASVWEPIIVMYPVCTAAPGIFGPVIVAMHPRPAHKAVATQGIMPFFEAVEAYTNVSSSAGRAGSEIYSHAHLLFHVFS